MTKSHMFALRITPEERLSWAEKAEKEGLSIAQWLRELANKWEPKVTKVSMACNNPRCQRVGKCVCG